MFHCECSQTRCSGSAVAVHRCSDQTFVANNAERMTTYSSPGKSWERKNYVNIAYMIPFKFEFL